MNRENLKMKENTEMKKGRIRFRGEKTGKKKEKT